MYKSILVGALFLQPLLAVPPHNIDSRKPEIAPVVEEKQFTQYEPAKEEKTLGEPVRVSSKASGDWVAQCHAWAAQAGISLPPAAIKLLERESHCNPNAVNRSSGACGIPQSLPCSKMGGVNENGTSKASATFQIRWMWNYVQQRYGSWEKALAHSYSHGWY